MNRRDFTTKAPLAFAAMGLSYPASPSPNPPEDSIYYIGPREGYTPQIGTLVTMLNYNRATVLREVSGLSVAQLDYLHDDNSNTIGALLLHLGATEVFYQANTFEQRALNAYENAEWGAASTLGDRGRAEIKGQPLSYYVDKITAVREKTLQELKSRDDDWLMQIDKAWSSRGTLNTYWKWFHVCEHEANHRGLMTWLRGRMPR